MVSCKKASLLFLRKLLLLLLRFFFEGSFRQGKLQLQGNTPNLWGGETPKGSVVVCDFYNAGANPSRFFCFLLLCRNLGKTTPEAHAIDVTSNTNIIALVMVIMFKSKQM